MKANDKYKSKVKGGLELSRENTQGRIIPVTAHNNIEFYILGPEFFRSRSPDHLF